MLKIIHDIDLHIGASSKQDGSETIIDTNTAVTRPLTSGDDLLLGHAEEHAEIPISNPSVASLRVNLLPRSSPTRDRPLRPSASISRLGSLDETEIVTTPSKISLMSPQPSKHTASATRLSTEDFLRSLQLETAIHSAVKSPTATTNTSTVRDEKPTLSTSTTSPNLYSCKRIRIELLNTWGDDTYIGLTGLQLLQGHDLVSVPLTAGLVHTMPRDLSSLGIYDDPRVSANLISNENNTTNGNHNSNYIF